MNGIGERSTSTHLGKTVLDLLPVLPDDRIGVIVDFTLQGCKLGLVCIEEYQTEISTTKWNDPSQEVRADKNFVLSVDASINPLKGLLKNN